MNSEDTSEYLFKEPCPSCGSQDNLARYSDGHGWCFGCDYYEPGEGAVPQQTRRSRMTHSELIDDAEYKALPKRGITEETCRRFGYQGGKYNGKTVQIANYRDEAGDIVAQKLRFADKDEGMPWLGNAKKATLFGQHIPVRSTP